MDNRPGTNKGGRRASDKVTEAGIDVMNHDSLEEILGIYSVQFHSLFSRICFISCPLNSLTLPVSEPFLSSVVSELALTMKVY